MKPLTEMTLVELIEKIYDHHGAGCCWHVVTDDHNWNLVGRCREYAMSNALCVTEGACQELASREVSFSAIRRAARKAMP